MSFDNKYNSKNIHTAYGTEPELCIYSGVPSAMFLANSAPEKDLEVIKNAIRNIEKIKPQKLVLISTVAVYNKSFGVNEDSEILEGESSAYGRNRR